MKQKEAYIDERRNRERSEGGKGKGSERRRAQYVSGKASPLTAAEVIALEIASSSLLSSHCLPHLCLRRLI